MNKKIVAARLAFSSLLLCGSAMAADVKLVFTGDVSSSTCSIDSGNGDGQYLKAVPLPTVSARALAKQNDVAGRELVTLELSGCTGTKVRTRFNRGANVDAVTGALINQALVGNGPVSSAQVQLLNSKYQPINLSTDAGAETVNIESGTAKLEFYAQYLAATPGTTPGKVETEVLLDLIYE
ncbi:MULTISPECIES: fimbrial protein [Achromobacter]|uniref:Fimbrial protein n=1 Tax=Achromobacter spanius TaxID=217203 RepID=A0ABY8GQN9_9BURK|nr:MULTISPECIES: fimbrial protein [Achromobacter]WAI83806.1 type 1 fimbrial protein [Achromobacter spanius]WEX93887.1 type 1 fimbrial protein [Achromobacter sp. SS2-2022]WFP06950.1 fimbrial protein [Achromobacter spanius]